MTGLEKILKLIVGTVFLIFRILRSRPIMNRLPSCGDQRDLFVLGNGPSLKGVMSAHADFLKGKDLFAVNTLCLFEEFTVLMPRYYILLDPAFYTRKDCLPEYVDLQEKLMVAFAKDVHWPMVLFIPASTDMEKEWRALEAQNPYVSICIVRVNYGESFSGVKRFFYKHNMAMPAPTNVLVSAIFLGLNMGYKNLWILGADHTWTRDLYVNDDNALYFVNRHFYGGKDAPCIKAHEGNNPWTMGELLSSYSAAFEAYSELDEYAGLLTAKIHNLTEGSFIDAFARKELASLFSEEK